MVQPLSREAPGKQMATGLALKVPEPYAGKLARTVLMGRKLSGCTSLKNKDNGQKRADHPM